MTYLSKQPQVRELAIFVELFLMSATVLDSKNNFMSTLEPSHSLLWDYYYENITPWNMN